jgi:nucleoside-diphosphate-sugar epimerase
VHDRFVVLFEGDFKRNYIHVRDVARVFQHGIDHFDAMRGQIYNVGLSEANVSKRELCQHIQKRLPEFVFLDAPVGQDPDQRNYIVSNAKLERTGFQPAVTLDAGIDELVKGFTMVKNTVHGNV